PAGEGVETWRLRPTGDTHGQGKVQTTNRKGGESHSGTKIRRDASPVRVRVPPPAISFHSLTSLLRWERGRCRMQFRLLPPWLFTLSMLLARLHQESTDTNTSIEGEGHAEATGVRDRPRPGPGGVCRTQLAGSNRGGGRGRNDAGSQRLFLTQRQLRGIQEE